MAEKNANTIGLLKPQWVKPLAYGALNIASASGIVFANKVVFSTYGFKFTVALTWVHTLTTLLGMRLFLTMGMFEAKPLPVRQLVPLAVAYVAYIVLCNLSLNMNSVGFYQVMKIAVAPTVLVLEALLLRRIPQPRVVASVLVVCLGIGVATVSDAAILTNLVGLGVGVAATLVTALYQIWAGSMQKELRASSMQLLYAYTPLAAFMLGALTPVLEPVGLRPAARSPETLLGYHYTAAAVAAITLSALLGLLVSLSTFLVIGATSSLTYNVVGHLKTVIILAGGCLFFGDAMPPKKLLGVCIAMLGIVWYTHLKLAAAGGTGAGGTRSKSLSGGAGGRYGAGHVLPLVSGGDANGTAADHGDEVMSGVTVVGGGAAAALGGGMHTRAPGRHGPGLPGSGRPQRGTAALLSL